MKDVAAAAVADAIHWLLGILGRARAASAGTDATADPPAAADVETTAGNCPSWLSTALSYVGTREIPGLPRRRHDHGLGARARRHDRARLRPR